MTETTEQKKKRSGPIPYAQKQEQLREAGLKNLEKLRTRESRARSEYHAIRREREQLEQQLGVPGAPNGNVHIGSEADGQVDPATSLNGHATASE